MEIAVDFIFMLTKDDQTVEDCLELHEEILPVGLTHVGFKDVGVDKATLKALTDAINVSGAISYMEVVSTTDEAYSGMMRGVAEGLTDTEIALVADYLQGLN